MSEVERQWQPMSEAPRDGTEIQARIPGHGSDNVIAWTDTLMNSDEEPCGGWQFTRDQEPPECWTDGICWESNEDEIQSVQPDAWKHLPKQVTERQFQRAGRMRANSAARRHKAKSPSRQTDGEG